MKFLKKNKILFLSLSFLLLVLGFGCFYFFIIKPTNSSELYSSLEKYNLSKNANEIAILCYLSEEDNNSYCFKKDIFNFEKFDLSDISEELYGYFQNQGNFLLLEYSKVFDKWKVEAPLDDYTNKLVELLENTSRDEFIQGEVTLDERNITENGGLYSFDLYRYFRKEVSLLRYYEKAGMLEDFSTKVSAVDNLITYRDPNINLVFNYPIDRKDLDYICPLLKKENCNYLKEETEQFFETLVDSLDYTLNIINFVPDKYTGEDDISYIYITEVLMADSYVLESDNSENSYSNEILNYKTNIEDSLNMNIQELSFKVNYLRTIDNPVLNYFYKAQKEGLNINRELSFVLFNICSNVDCGDNFEIANLLLKEYE